MDVLRRTCSSQVVSKVSSGNLKDIYFEQTMESKAEVVDSGHVKTRVGYGDRTVQYIILFVYLGFAAAVGIWWAVWYTLRLFSKKAITKEKQADGNTKSE